MLPEPEEKQPKSAGYFLDTSSETPTAETEQDVINRAVDVIGDRDEALRWMGTPVRALGYATPISLLSREEGRAVVLTTLTRLEHGVW